MLRQSYGAGGNSNYVEAFCTSQILLPQISNVNLNRQGVENCNICFRNKITVQGRDTRKMRQFETRQNKSKKSHEPNWGLTSHSEL